MFDDVLEEDVQEAIVLILGILFNLGVSEVDMYHLLRIFNVSDEVAAEYSGQLIEFDEAFFNEYQRITGEDLRMYLEDEAEEFNDEPPTIH